MGAVFLCSAVFQPGVDTVAVICRTEAAFVRAEIVLAEMFAVPTVFLGEGLPAFHNHHLSCILQC